MRFTPRAEEQRIQSSAQARYLRYLPDGEQRAGYVWLRALTRVMAHDQPLSGAAEDDFGADRETRQPHRVDLGAGNVHSTRFARTNQV
jgi:hypothetical protein